MKWNQYLVTLLANTSKVLVNENRRRKALRWMNVGVNPCTVVPSVGHTVIVGEGFNYSGASETGYQGGSDNFPAELSSQGFSAISTIGTTVIVWEGIE